MIIVSSISYPPESANEIAKRFLETPAIPDYMTKKGPYTSSSIEESITTFSFYDVDRSNFADGYEFLGKFMATFFGINGFRYEIRPYFEIEEAMKMVGM
jgi:hypothetical protein